MNLRVAFAILVIFLGITGLFLPIIPGILIIFFGIYLINPEWMKEKYHQWRHRKKRG